ncbi:hypothetical protein EJ02DRAFT_467613 [Clathrospora elynae]|uniref:Myb-like domain-containing protein n=1 Tax=Clathrospora elynae TaxID=706981 RepID=A0A6A5SKJ3_9PLEO|nr:hypothetical protein EJ02DRAFT_467613 [Clathrospora elynae]
MVMSIILDGPVPPPHLLQNRSASWPIPYHPHDYPAPALSPASMSPQPLHSYMSHMAEIPLPSQEVNSLPNSSWYSPSIPAPECHSETSYASYGHYMPPHTSSINLSPPATMFPYPGKASLSTQIDPLTAVSPGSVYSRDSVVPESARPSEEPQSDARGALYQSTSRLRTQSRLMHRPQSSSGPLHSAPVDISWTMNPLGIHSPHESYYPAFSTLTRSPRLSEPLIELPSNHMASPQPRRMYTPIAPLPLETPRSHGARRFREEEDDVTDESKRRKRSDSNASARFELSEEDRLLLQLKEEESMPWKDIAARFQSDLGKNYQIPALQMRLKRLRERMRVWNETDVRALRMAHEYWVQNKFDIVAQKMLEYGAQEKWTARQCARKWAEIDPAPTPFAQFEHHVHQGFAPYAMSPVEPPPSYIPFLHVQ